MRNEAAVFSFARIASTVLAIFIAGSLFGDTRALQPGADAQNPALAVNKHHEPNQSSTSWQLGVPITYVVTIHNGGSPAAHVTLKDTLPAGFMLTGTTCTPAGGAVCAATLTTPPYGEFNIPTGGDIELHISGYFVTTGTKVNFAEATAKDDQGQPLDVGTANTSKDQLEVPTTPTSWDLSIDKAGTVISSVFPAKIHYKLTIKNNSPDPIDLGGLLLVRDNLYNNSTIAVSYTASNFTCAPAAVCPAMPATLTGTISQNNTVNFDFKYAANSSGTLPGNSAFTIDFDVDLTTAATCSTGAVTMQNRAFLEEANGSTLIPDKNAGNNTSQQISTTVTGLPTTCPPKLAPTVTKTQNNAAVWDNAPGVKYTVSVTNPSTTTTFTNISLSDSIYKITGTPTFTATVSSGPTCVSGCIVSLTTVVLSTPTVSSDFIASTLWTATLPSLGPGQTISFQYAVVYSPVCETDPRSDTIVNQFFATPSNASGTGTAVVTTPPEASPCDLEVKKRKKTAGPIVFGSLFEYEVVYHNLSTAATRTIGTLRDVISVDSGTYGDIPFTYTVACTASGAVTPPAPKSGNGAIRHPAFPWMGVKLIDEHNVTFGPGAQLTCTVGITPQRPVDDNPFCQGMGTPHIDNAAFLDLSPNYNPNDSHQPGFYAHEIADLPLCRKVIVTKTAVVHNVGPGATITYTITVENKGDDPVSGLILKDAVPAPLQATSVAPCNPAAGCSTAPTLTGNTVDVKYATLQPNQPVSFNLTVTAPQAGGSYPNLAQGSFLSGGYFYFQGDEKDLLEQEENITVLTPVLTKSFSPVKIGANASSTLTFQVTNTNSDPKQSGMSFSDTLPSGLQFSGSPASDCGGTVLVSSDHRTLTLTGGQLVGSNSDGSGKHSCKITATVTAMGMCGVFKNKKSNFTDVTNLDVSGIDEQLEVTDCAAGLDIVKQIDGAPEGFHGQFTFTVKCNGYQKTVTVDWPSPGFIKLTDAPLGQCTVSEVPPTAELPEHSQWGSTTYTPSGGVVTVGDKGGQVTAVNHVEQETSCARIINSAITCEVDKSGKPTGNYIWKFQFQNLSGKPINQIYIADLPAPLVALPDHFVFNPPVTGTSPQIQVTLHNGQPGPVTLTLSLHDQGLECCAAKVTIDLPPCNCAQIVREITPSCFSDPFTLSLRVPPPYTYTFTLQNLSPLLVQNVLIAAVSPLDHVTPIPTSSLTVTGDVFPVAAVGQGGAIGPLTVSIGGPQAVGGQEVCLSLILQTDDLNNCCSIVRCFTLPNCKFNPNDITAIGGAVLTQLGTGFTIDHIGATGEDGISVKLHDARAAAMAWRPLDEAGPLPNGAFFEMRAAGNPGDVTGKVRVTQTDAGYAINPSIADASTYTLEVFQGAQSVGTAAQQRDGNVVVIWPVAAGVDIVDATPDTSKTLAFTLRTDIPTVWRLSDGSTLTGDTLRITPEQTAGTVSLQTMELRAANIPTINVTGTSIFRDCNGNGAPDAEDVANGTSADANHNGIPDECEKGSDLAVSLNSGFDQAAGTLLPNGADDDDWRLISPAPERAAKVVSQPNSAWPLPLPESRWISADASGASLPGVTHLVYQRCFCLANSAGDVAVDLQLRADDEATVSLNGQTLGGPGGRFGDAKPLSILRRGTVGDGLFVAGRNCITVDVRDIGVVTGFTLSGTVISPGGACEP
jgi:uncharacterized repeat protein (TIGR01451 family)